jgi:hypothetical protein
MEVMVRRIATRQPRDERMAGIIAGLSRDAIIARVAVALAPGQAIG